VKGAALDLGWRGEDLVGCARPKRTVLRVRVARSASSERKECTGRPSSVRLVAALRLAAASPGSPTRRAGQAQELRRGRRSPHPGAARPVAARGLHALDRAAARQGAGRRQRASCVAFPARPADRPRRAQVLVSQQRSGVRRQCGRDRRSVSEPAGERDRAPSRREAGDPGARAGRATSGCPMAARSTAKRMNTGGAATAPCFHRAQHRDRSDHGPAHQAAPPGRVPRLHEPGRG
jgi:hypothetical protein